MLNLITILKLILQVAKFLSQIAFLKIILINLMKKILFNSLIKVDLFIYKMLIFLYIVMFFNKIMLMKEVRSLLIIQLFLNQKIVNLNIILLNLEEQYVL